VFKSENKNSARDRLSPTGIALTPDDADDDVGRKEDALGASVPFTSMSYDTRPMGDLQRDRQLLHDSKIAIPRLTICAR
jgi:hypothetical protein